MNSLRLPLPLPQVLFNNSARLSKVRLTVVHRGPVRDRAKAVVGALRSDRRGLNRAAKSRLTADDADLYQYTGSEGWSLEEGIVKPAPSSIDQVWACARSW
jgi:hypothetical protein